MRNIKNVQKSYISRFSERLTAFAGPAPVILHVLSKELQESGKWRNDAAKTAKP
jgi:hypothetical protein